MTGLLSRNMTFKSQGMLIIPPLMYLIHDVMEDSLVWQTIYIRIPFSISASTNSRSMNYSSFDHTCPVSGQIF